MRTIIPTHEAGSCDLTFHNPHATAKDCMDIINNHGRLFAIHAYEWTRVRDGDDGFELTVTFRPALGYVEVTVASALDTTTTPDPPLGEPGLAGE